VDKARSAYPPIRRDHPLVETLRFFHPTLTRFRFTRKAVPVLDLRYILVTNCEDLTDKRLRLACTATSLCRNTALFAPCLAYNQPLGACFIALGGWLFHRNFEFLEVPINQPGCCRVPQFLKAFAVSRQQRRDSRL